jgi:myo-inositol-1(or 4)-monophosphatase
MASEVDYAVERAVRSLLAERTPRVGFLGEQEGASGTFTADSLMWVLGPVDGTANFVRGLPLCGVSLALVVGTRPVLGVVDLPFLGARYSAAEGTGAYRGGRRLRNRATSSLADAVVSMLPNSVGDYAVGQDAIARNRMRLALTEELAVTVQRVRMLGSAAVDLAWFAEGHTDASISLSNKPWDTAAGVVIAREAGAQVVDLDGSRHDLGSAATVAVTATLLDPVLSLLSGLTAATVS